MKYVKLSPLVTDYEILKIKNYIKYVILYTVMVPNSYCEESPEIPI